MPKLWNDTIEAHRQAVRDATLDTAAALAIEHGIAAITMSRIAEETGIGRATLYKYFPDVEAILVAWHERQMARHLQELEAAGRSVAEPGARLEAVLRTYAKIAHDHHGTVFSNFLHTHEHARHAEQHLRHFVGSLIAEAAQAGQLRSDVAADELAIFVLAALSGAASLPSDAAVQRLVGLTIEGMRHASTPRR